jgi:Rod binding domain-containing protein
MTVSALASLVHTPAATQHANARAWATAQDFESTFVSTMFQTMFQGIKTDGPFGGGQGEETFRSLLVDQYGREMTRAGGIGIADKIYGEILKMQEHGQ